MTSSTTAARSAVPEDVALIRERIHPATMAAEGPLHELGAIAIVNSDSQGMGRIMETVRRTIQLAHVDEGLAAPSGGCRPPGPARRADDGDDNERVLRYLAKVTVEPAITHGVADHVGSLAARPARGHRALEARVLRRQAGARPQGRPPGLGAARRGQRDASSAPSRRATRPSGPASRTRRRPRRRSRPRAPPTAAAARRPAAASSSRSPDAWPHARRLALQPRDRADRGRSRRRPGHPRRPPARRRAPRRGPAQPPLLPALSQRLHGFRVAADRLGSSRAATRSSRPHPSRRRSTTSRPPRIRPRRSRRPSPGRTASSPGGDDLERPVTCDRRSLPARRRPRSPECRSRS